MPSSSLQFTHQNQAYSGGEVSVSKNPIVAMFLVKFDVHTGYSLEWFEKIDVKGPEQYSLDNIEFKALPSGLHTKGSDVIYFVHSKPGQESKIDGVDILYGVSVYSHNIHDAIHSREDVKMYSLGVLVDPGLNNMLSNNSSLPSNVFSDHYLSAWKPTNYTLGFDYISKLGFWLAKFMEGKGEALLDYSAFHEFYESHRVDIDKKSKAKRRSSFHSATNPFLELLSEHDGPRKEHMISSLVPLIQGLGPSIFTVWKYALLRKRILLYSPATSIEENCDFSYCLSILSTVPKEVLPVLKNSGCRSDLLDFLRYYQPLYNIGINDIDHIESIDLVFKSDDGRAKRQGFVATTTDEIILYKSQLYDISVTLGSSGHSDHQSIISSAVVSPELPKATQRDLRKLKVLYDHYDLSISHACAQTACREDDTDNYDEDESYESLQRWWAKVSEPVTWSEFAWSGFLWWASAGEANIVANEMDREYLSTLDHSTSVSNRSNPLGGPLSSGLVDSLNIVGYFQNMTIRIFSIITELVMNELSGDEPGYQDDEDETLPPSSAPDIALYIESNDIYEMGLDPYSIGDHEFILELVMLYWSREVKFGGRICNVLC
ncbi:hypothetical protein BABINDRAFT_40103 [Babjeviella inositovora NRRL Y-12698]|uniref:DUF4484 domain-containing protein n=1 Tax=Babjeviella inositovora NRRL Y-12698 TaxID=984486 RepID=A0A1E3QKQ0_9ASCO|nr:uncharacterized protein BABINDRAFT_40103 [Babjeviella inositovora NRRL Y-12698]ODQ78279.1 hypothetical protein BABINDRAFT_40103 [Babjeviella inositovora NRRL Y-12698]